MRALLQRVREARVGIGEFGAEMAVSLVNDGPVTIWMDSSDGAKSQ